MTKLSTLRLAAPLVLLAAGGCAHYAAQPLGEAQAGVPASDPARLSQDAARIDRPFLKPQAIDLTAPLSGNALAVIAVLENPDLKALRGQLGVAQAQAFAARLLPDPAAQLGFDKLLHGPDAFNAFAGQLGLDLGLLRKSAVARQAGAAAVQRVRLDIAWAEWQTAGAARLQGIRIVALTAQLGLLQASAVQAERLFDATRRAAARGDVAGAELDARRQSALDAAEKLRGAEQGLSAARGELNRLLGLPPATVLAIAPELAPEQSGAAQPSAEALTRLALTRRLDLAALRAGYEGAEADLHAAILDQFPDLSLNLSAARDTSLNTTLGPQIGFTLPLWNRNRGGIAVARATREQVRGEYQARLFQTRAEIAAALTLLEQARRQRADLAAQLPALAHFAETSQQAARRGDLGGPVAEAAMQALRDRQVALLQLDQAAAEAWLSLELLSGGTSEGWSQ